MSLGIRRAWVPVTPEIESKLPVTTGVFEIRNAQGEILDIAYAGSRELFGLRSGIFAAVAALRGEGLEVRFETHIQYQSRYLELVLSHRALHGGEEPARVSERAIPVTGRLSVG